MRTTTKTTAALDEFATRAAEQAMRGAIAFLVPAGTRLGWSAAEIDSLLVEIRAEVKIALPAALADAQAAFACGMGGYAGATFGASMTLAGTTAAKRWQAARA